uniref:Uncharacterized protein n=1 Tax=Gasterosteus aculeatus aculeatus TaxID=481459 RepID=A0AAQ4PN41_GASAC
LLMMINLMEELGDVCQVELAEIIMYARVLAIHPEPLVDSLYNSLLSGFRYGYEGAEEGLLYTAEVEFLCDQAWGSMLEVPSGSRLNLTGLGFLSCQSHTVMENYSYFFFLRSVISPGQSPLLPHGVNFQDTILADRSDNRRTFFSLFQFSNCTQGSHVPFFTRLQSGGRGQTQKSNSRLLTFPAGYFLNHWPEPGTNLQLSPGWLPYWDGCLVGQKMAAKGPVPARDRGCTTAARR